MVGEANLYTLGILSLFFHEQAKKFGLTQMDIDPKALKKDARDKEYLKDRKEVLRICLNRFLKPE